MGRWETLPNMEEIVEEVQKYLTVAIPCYNSQEYMRKCVESLLTGGERMDIVIVNDGSSDHTIDIANEYAEKYPTIVRVVDKENGGHGSGVNAGLDIARGLYYKVVDSDDWADEEGLRKLLERIAEDETSGLPDLYVVNYIYEHVADGTRNVCTYRRQFPVGEKIGWDKVKGFHLSRMLIMHALVYRTSVLRESGLRLPEHTFYVDDIFSYNPLPYVKTLCYLDIDFYHYFIGRADQSVALPNMLKRYEQQIRVMLAMTDAWTYREVMAQSKGLKKYMFHALENYMLTTLLFVCGLDSPERRQAYHDMWLHIKERDPEMYGKLFRRSYAAYFTWMPWKMRALAVRTGYKITCRTVKLG